jgi:type III restriction enzyme
MKLQFDPSQQYQLDAISAIVDLFAGQPLCRGAFEMEVVKPEGQALFGSQFVIRNNLVLDGETILKNLNSVQARHDVEISKQLDGLNFSVEMETGTGKSYVYLRTIHELNKRYGFKKFIIVVPSIAIKEGTLKNLNITREHFNMLYENPQMDFYVYDSQKRTATKNFATTNSLQIMVINIDSFAKFSEDKNGKNIIYQDSDWGVPVEFIQSVRPVVIVDEPQNMETEIRKKAIENLNPLCTLRYSATHKFNYNLVHKLGPVKAYDLGLVKKIEVDSVFADNSFNNAFIELRALTPKAKKIVAKIRIDTASKEGIARKDVLAEPGSDLFDLSGRREIYQNGYIVDSIDTGAQTITFSNGLSLTIGQSLGGLTDEVMKFQIRKTVENHFEKELLLKSRGIKVLSLFFVDRVANYRLYQDGTAQKGKFALWFEEIYSEVISKSEYKGLIPYPVDQVHNGYFSQDRKGIVKDTNGNTKDDDDTYALIMRDKEKLLSPEEPLRFIFSHSALREGWDNPNVFQICTLNEAKSEIKKRQEIGRGLRLPVDKDGKRIQDENINILTVTATERFEDFAKCLQTEIEDDCGEDFKGRIRDKNRRKSVRLKKGFALDPNFKALWDRISTKTRYQVNYDTAELVKKASQALGQVTITAPKIVNIKAALDISKKGIETHLEASSARTVTAKVDSIPDVLGYIQSKTKLTKDTIFKIIQESGRIADIFKNPQQFMDLAAQQINTALQKMMVDGIKYEKIAGQQWEMKLFENEELESYLDNMVKVKNQDKTIYDQVVIESEVERKFAEALDSRKDVKFYLKLPSWFVIHTPIGTYNPDWAIMFENQKRLYFVAETKSKGQELRESETMKIHCGKRHFENFEDVTFKAPVSDLSEIQI